ncbi:MAG: 50S ribosomal protein L25 [Calditrichaceae bacterium]|nr:50S ribosomal protein L25 [Calditrichia bacterium]NUQ42322.1 50S ribosomal protein L25 [Calditrichaceae bacterium]
MATVVIEARKRDKSGTRNARQYRREGLVPGVFYIDGKEAVPLLFDAKNLSNFLSHTRGLVELEISGEKAALECVLKEVQYHPVTDEPLHVDFLGVKMDEKIEIQVPLILKGTPEGVKTGGILEHLVRQLTIECFPGNIPNILEVDVSGLAVGKSVRVGDLKYENIAILNDPNETVALVELPKAAISELEEMPQEAEITEPEVIGKGKEAEEQEEQE